jgi:hypothetical protein
MALEQHTDSGSDGSACSPSSGVQEPEQEKCGTTHYAGCACHEQGWANKWKCAVEMAAQAEVNRDEWMYRAKAAERTVDNLNETIDRIKDQDIAVYAAARAVVDRWDTPLWKDAPATAGFINRLRAALSSENAWSDAPGARYLCRIKLPLPVRFVADLATLFPGKNVRMKDEGGYLCIFSENVKRTCADS